MGEKSPVRGEGRNLRTKIILEIISEGISVTISVKIYITQNHSKTFKINQLHKSLKCNNIHLDTV